MERPCCSRSTENQAARIRLIIGVFFDNLPSVERFKRVVHSDQPEGF
jgi:hypothetical protein